MKRSPSGFTLIEMMIVIVLIVLLAGMVFRMVGYIGSKNDESKTRAILEKVGNALEEYRSIYGKYPDVRVYPIYKAAEVTDTGELASFEPKPQGTWQPVGYEFPSAMGFNRGRDLSAAEKYGENMIKEDLPYGNPDGKNAGILFTFGLVSYFVPRYNGTASEGISTLTGYYKRGSTERQSSDKAHAQWRIINNKRDGSVGDSERDLAAVRRILPHLDTYLVNTDKLRYNPASESHMLHGTFPVMHQTPNTWKNYGILHEEAGVSGAGCIYRPIQSEGWGGKGVILNRKITIWDAWNHEIHYKSLPPYDTYDIWSDGKDGKSGTADDIHIGSH